MQSATVVRDKVNGTIHIRISKGDPQTGGHVDLIEIIHQKEGEDLEKFKERVIKFVNERVP